MLDDNYKYPVAKVKSADNGSYTITTNDVKTFLLDTATHDKIKNDYGFTMPSAVTNLSSSSSGSALDTAFESLGPLRIRAMYKSGDKILAMTSMADPKEDTVELNPVLARASEQIMGALVETIKSTINSISSDIFTDDLKSKMISSVLATVTKSVNETLLKYQDTVTFDLEEGTSVSNPEDLFDVSSSMDSSEIAALETELTSTDEEVSDTFTVATVTDTGKLADTLSDEEKGELDKQAEVASASASSTVGAEDASAGKQIKVRD